MIAATPNRVLKTVFGRPPRARQASPIWPPTSSPTKPAKNMANSAPPSCLMSSPCTAEQIGRHPGQQAIENGVEEHPAEAHAPDRTIAEIGPVPTPDRRGGQRILARHAPCAI